MGSKKSFSMTKPKSAVEAFVETQEKKEKEDKTPKKQTQPKEETTVEKKSTLTAKDREKMKTDFDPPTEKRAGKPRKYNETLSRVSFALPASVVDNLKVLAAIEKKNQTEIILDMINKEVQREKDKIEKYNKLFS